MTGAKKSPARGARKSRAAGRSEVSRLRLLYNISNILTTTQRGDAVLKGILREAVRAMQATSGSLILIDREAGLLNIEIAHKIDKTRAAELKLRIGEGVTGWVAQHGVPLLVGDVRHSPHYVNIRSEVRSELAVPLIINDEVIGVLNVDSDQPGAFTPEDQALMVAIAAQSARVMQTAWLYEENIRKADKLATLLNVARAVVSEPLLEDVLRLVANEVRDLLGVRVCSIMLLDEAGKNFEIKAFAGVEASAYANRSGTPVAGSLIGRVLESCAPLYFADVRRQKGFMLASLARELGLCSLLSVPMSFMERPIGVLNVYTSEKREFREDEISLLSAFAGYAAVAIINARRYDRIIRSEEMLRRSEKFSLLGTLSAEIAHEIRNPLAILTMLVHAIRRDEGLSAESRTDLGVMETKLTHINGIVDQVLDFARSPQAESRAVTDPNEILDDVLMLLRHKASAAGKTLRTRLPDRLPPVMVNAGQIEQAILNIALNGLDAMQEKGGCLHFATGTLDSGGERRVFIRIRDEGIGMTEETLSRIFSPFFSMRPQGTGLGLFITQRIIEQHGGRLNVKSRPGRGSTFEIELPAHNPSPASRSAQSHPAHG